jgi:hypothetical protein
MKTLRKWILVALSVVMLVVLANPVLPPATAQDSFCPAGLSDEDCEILAQSDAAMADVQSFNNTFSIDFGVVVNNSTELVFSAVGSGPMLTSESEPAADFIFENAAVSAPNGEAEGPGALRLIGDHVYAAAENEDGALEWSGGRIETAEGTGSFDVTGLTAVFTDSGLAEYVAWTREDDAEVNGQPSAVFRAEVNLSELIYSDMVLNVLSQSLLESGGDIDPAMASFGLGLVLDEISNQLEDRTLVGWRYISLDDYRITRLVLETDLGISLAFVGSMIADAGLPQSIDLTLNFESNLDQYNDDFDIQAPDEWQDVGPIDPLALFNEVVLMPMIEASSTTSTPGASGNGALSAEFEIAVGEEATGTLDETDNPSDVYRFEASEGDQVTITMQKADAEADLDPLLVLYDSNGTRLTFNDDAANPEGIDDFDAQIENFVIPADGAYFIEAQSTFLLGEADYILTLE